jgi:hypothetical protein
MRAALLLTLLALPAGAQVFPWSGGGSNQCSVDPARDDTSTTYVSSAVSGEDGFVLANSGARLRLAPTSVNSGAYLAWDSSIGVVIGNNAAIAPGGSVVADNMQPRRATETLKLNGEHGVNFQPRASVGTCGSTSEPEGTMLMLAGTVTSQTRLCTCISTGGGSPAFRWRNNENAVGSTTTDCPEITP